MLIVGLSGKYCAGKSTMAAALVREGASEIDVDRLGHEVLESCRAQVVETFGRKILKTDGFSIDRSALGLVVFADPKALARLEAITHPALSKRVTELIETARQPMRPIGDANAISQIVIVNAALLFKMKLDLLCDLVIWVEAPWIVRLFRGLRRDKRGFWPTVRLMQRQKSLGPQHRGQNADIVKVNSLYGERFPARLRAILERYNG